MFQLAWLFIGLASVVSIIYTMRWEEGRVDFTLNGIILGICGIVAGPTTLFLSLVYFILVVMDKTDISFNKTLFSWPAKDKHKKERIKV